MKFQGSLFCSTIMAKVYTYTHDLKIVPSPAASPSHPRNEEGERAEGPSQMSFSSLKIPHRSHTQQLLPVSTSLARTLSHAALNERGHKEVGIFNSSHCCPKPN